MATMEFSQEISYVHHSPTYSTEEDEDMAANCLILLAQGGCRVKQVAAAAGKISSRKFSEMATGGGKAAAGLYVYECKTCNRSFPSFQALGGHRASHKKPKLMDHHEHHHQDHYDQQSPPPPQPQPPLSAAHGGSSKLAKIHECSICRAEFSSGQALGGHMRRHRPAAPINTAAAAKGGSVSSSNDEEATESSDGVGGNPRAAVFSLDLNLPAPQEEEEGGHGNKFEFSAKQQQSLVFSVPALVDCHY
ncbi:PREDICTED: zinc finger protein ZAT5 [Ipomoea nil]|uniref:zinc finger protein ZAT5 n=1 Tax=Ipomoea nil TaxID=35883 RepID=UPI0009017094|nr:PREDICTED: zinc finger protein ZAT5 [Ipomoea nil]